MSGSSTLVSLGYSDVNNLTGGYSGVKGCVIC